MRQTQKYISLYSKVYFAYCNIWDTSVCSRWIYYYYYCWIRRALVCNSWPLIKSCRPKLYHLKLSLHFILSYTRQEQRGIGGHLSSFLKNLFESLDSGIIFRESQHCTCLKYISTPKYCWPKKKSFSMNLGMGLSFTFI